MIYRFCNCELDTECLELRRGDELQAVEPQVFSLLLHLIENRDHVLTKDDLISAIWQGRIVSDTSLSSRISAVRSAVGDTGSSQSIIRTMPKRGFRFVANVVHHDTTQPAPPLGGRIDVTTDSVTDQITADKDNRPGIAVLPFDNLSEEPEQEYFSDGLADDLIAGLSLFRGLLVIARNSTFTYRGASTDIGEMARAFGVRYVLEGSVRKSGNRIRIAVQLIDATSGGHVWVERYDRELVDIFDLQDEITECVVSAISPAIIDAEMKRALRRRPDSLDAHESYLRGLWCLRKLKKSANAEAQNFFRKAIVIDPNFAQAHAWLAFSMWIDVWHAWVPEAGAWLASAYTFGKRATALDNRDDWGYIALGIICTFMKRTEAGLSAAQRAVDLNPGNHMSHISLGIACLMSERYEEAIASYNNGMRLSPADPLRFASFGGQALAYYELRRYEEAIERARRAIRDRHGYIMARAILTASLARLTRDRDAAAELAEIVRLKPDFAVASFANYPWRGAVRDQLLDGLRLAGLQD